MTIRCALIQTTTPLRPEAAFLHVLPLINQAVQAQARFIFLPEAVNRMDGRAGFAQDGIYYEQDDPFIAQIKALCRHFSCSVLIGSAIVRSEIDPMLNANRSLWIGPDGAVLGRYDKIHLFDATMPDGRVYKESASIKAGHAPVMVATAQARFGLSICYDVRFSALYRYLATSGAHIICVPAAFTVPTGQAHWEVMVRARAIETGCFILAPAQGSNHQDGRVTYGHTMAVNPWGDIIAKLDHDQPDFLVVDLDLSEIEQARQAIPQLKAHTPFDIGLKRGAS